MSIERRTLFNPVKIAAEQSYPVPTSRSWPFHVDRMSRIVIYWVCMLTNNVAVTAAYNKRTHILRGVLHQRLKALLPQPQPLAFARDAGRQ